MKRVAWVAVVMATVGVAPAGAEIVRQAKPAAIPAPVTAPIEAPSSSAPTQTEVADDTLVAPPADAPRDNIRWPKPDTPAPASVPPVEGEAPVEASPPEPRGNIRWPQTQEGAKPPPEEASDLIEGSDVPPQVSRVDAFREGMAAYARTGDAQRHEAAARSLRIAAEAGDLRAAAALGYLQAMGLGVPRDAVRGRQQLVAASAAGLARADYLLSLIEHNDRRPGAAQREATYRESAARRGDALAQNAMGVHYQRQGDRATAELWYRRAAEAGSVSAKQNLAALTTPATTADASTPTRPDADGAEALYAQARRYHRGEDVAVDYGQALRFYRAAAARGSEPARQMLGLIQSRPGTSGAVDPLWMRQLASASVGDARSNVVTRVSEAPVRAPRLDDPLSGLAALSAGTGPASAPRASAARRIP